MKKESIVNENKEKITNILTTTNRILKILYVLIIICSTYIFLVIAKELNVFSIILSILTILTPFFIGLAIAWLFNPLVMKLEQYGIRRWIGVSLIYLVLIGFFFLIVGSLIPLLYDQIVDFVETIPSLFDKIEHWVSNFFAKIDGIKDLDISSMKQNVFDNLDKFSNNLYNSLPTIVIDSVKSIISGIGTFLIGLVLGFFLLLGFDNVGETLISYLPKRYRSDAKMLTLDINGSLRSYVTGTLLDACLIFMVSSIVFWLIGLKAPLLFGVFCAITNVIPYIGPYIGAVPAVIVGFSMSPTTGFLVLVAIFIIQMIEGNCIQALIMSKTTKLHPVTIIIGLLIFGHFWGILGMLVSTPIIAISKVIVLFIDKKTGILDYVEK